MVPLVGISAISRSSKAFQVLMQEFHFLNFMNVGQTSITQAVLWDLYAW